MLYQNDFRGNRHKRHVFSYINHKERKRRISPFWKFICLAHNPQNGHTLRWVFAKCELVSRYMIDNEVYSFSSNFEYDVGLKILLHDMSSIHLHAFLQTQGVEAIFSLHLSNCNNYNWWTQLLTFSNLRREMRIPMTVTLSLWRT